MVLFHSINPQQARIDFIYQDSGGTFPTFQATLGEKQTSPQSLIQRLKYDLENSRVALSYLIPADRFDTFVTIPVNPEMDDLTSVWHILIPNPNKEKRES